MTLFPSSAPSVGPGASKGLLGAGGWGGCVGTLSKIPTNVFSVLPFPLFFPHSHHRQETGALRSLTSKMAPWLKAHVKCLISECPGYIPQTCLYIGCDSALNRQSVRFYSHHVPISSVNNTGFREEWEMSHLPNSAEVLCSVTMPYKSRQNCPKAG